MSDKVKQNRIGVKVVKAINPDGRVIPGASEQISDPFSGLYETDGIIEPPYAPETFLRLPEMSNVLRPLIDAYKTNITGFGYQFKYLIDMESKEIDEGIKEQAKKDWLKLQGFYDYCHYDQSFNSLTKRIIDDRETIGWGALEVIPKGNGEPGTFEYIPAHTLRLSKLHPIIQEIPITVVNFDGTRITVKYAKKFRKFCQIIDNTRVWFKEFGDPRKMDCKTGRFESEINEAGVEVTTVIEPHNIATSIMFFPIPSAYTPYGVPRWLGTLLSMFGSRKAEEINYNYFEKGKHIPMAILVKNGMLTKSSIEELQGYSNKLSGSDNAHGYLIIEAEGFEGDDFDNNKSQVDIKLQPLTQVIQHDALFQEYDKTNRDKIRAAFRLPPIYTGESKDYTRATADTARSIAEEQIFQPERDEIATRFNKQINNALKVKYAAMYFKGPNLTNKLELAQAVNIYAKAGALTPNMLIGAVSDLLDIEFEAITDDWGNIPLQLSIENIRQLGGVKVDEVDTEMEGTTIETPVEPNTTTEGE